MTVQSPSPPASGRIFALTVWQPWASLIMVGAKPFEWRRWRAPAAYVGQEIVIHAGARRLVRDEVEDIVDRLAAGDSAGGLIADKALALLLPILEFGEQLPSSAGLGTVRLGAPRQATELVATGEVTSIFDSDRVDEAVWGWPVSDIKRWADPMPMRGSQGFWRWPDATAAAAAFIPEEEVPY
jgi:hypothetical protein